MKKETIKRIRDFTIDRDWDQFHSPANLAKSISIEANELLECFQWDENNYDLNEVKEELADVRDFFPVAADVPLVDDVGDAEDQHTGDDDEVV